MSPPRSKIDILLNLVPENPERVLQQLESEPDLASAQDSHGYSLLHAAASYSHPNLIRTLIETYNVPANILDEDNETPLFAVEKEEIAQLLLELGADISRKNDDGLTAEEKMEGEEEFPLVAAFLRQRASSSGGAANGTSAPALNGDASLAHPPPMPNGMTVSIGTMAEPEGEGPDPEFRRRIEELAAREDFQSEEGQRQLRELVTDAVTGLREDANQDGRETSRRRVEE